MPARRVRIAFGGILVALVTGVGFVSVPGPSPARVVYSAFLMRPNVALGQVPEQVKPEFLGAVAAVPSPKPTPAPAAPICSKRRRGIRISSSIGTNSLPRQGTPARVLFGSPEPCALEGWSIALIAGIRTVRRRLITGSSTEPTVFERGRPSVMDMGART